MDFNQVRYFVALADTLNFTRAAERCFISQPALTQLIKRLEGELGGPLFERQGRLNGLTQLGTELRGYFEDLVATKDLVNATARVVNNCKKADLNIGIMHDIGPGIVISAIECFQIEHEDISIILHDVSEDDAAEMLIRGELDAAFCIINSTTNSKLTQVDLFEEQMVVAFDNDHEFLQKDKVTLQEVAKEPYIDRLHCNYRKQFFGFCRENDFKPHIVFRSHRDEWLKSMVCDGLGVTIVPRFTISDSNMCFRELDAVSYCRQISFLWCTDSIKVDPMPQFVDAICTLDWRKLTKID